MIWSIGEIELIVYDFDGVMTNNRALVLEDGTEGVWVNRSDGIGVARIRALGIPQLILSSEPNRVVTVRARKLGLEVLHNCDDKAAALRAYCKQHGYDLQKVIYVGNDINDLEAMQCVGMPVAPKDAYPEILAVATLITSAAGGQGVVRELYSRITRAT